MRAVSCETVTPADARRTRHSDSVCSPPHVEPAAGYLVPAWCCQKWACVGRTGRALTQAMLRRKELHERHRRRRGELSWFGVCCACAGIQRCHRGTAQPGASDRLVGINGDECRSIGDLVRG